MQILKFVCLKHNIWYLVKWGCDEDFYRMVGWGWLIEKVQKIIENKWVTLKWFFFFTFWYFCNISWEQKEEKKVSLIIRKFFFTVLHKTKSIEVSSLNFRLFLLYYLKKREAFQTAKYTSRVTSKTFKTHLCLKTSRKQIPFLFT